MARPQPGGWEERLSPTSWNQAFAPGRLSGSGLALLQQVLLHRTHGHLRLFLAGFSSPTAPWSPVGVGVASQPFGGVYMKAAEHLCPGHRQQSMGGVDDLWPWTGVVSAGAASLRATPAGPHSAQAQERRTTSRWGGGQGEKSFPSFRDAERESLLPFTCGQGLGFAQERNNQKIPLQHENCHFFLPSTSIQNHLKVLYRCQAKAKAQPCNAVPGSVGF